MGNNDVFFKIKRLMEIENCSQRDLASNIGISEVSMSRYLRGNRKITIDFVIKISNYFNVSIDWLLNDQKNG